MAYFKNLVGFPLCLALLLLPGCNSTGQKDSPVQGQSFDIKNIAKSDVDMVAEVHLGLALKYLESLTEKLYRRNPREWRKGGQPSVEAAVDRIFGTVRPLNFRTLNGQRSIHAMRLAFDETYTGDRVLALMEGLRGMLLDSYNGKQEFYLLDELDPQKLHNAARNVETAVWKLSNDRAADGRLFLVSNEMSETGRNLSFERLFGKIIALQDSMAQIVADATNRRIKNVIQSVASSVFIGI
jgi:hypothetical protein